MTSGKSGDSSREKLVSMILDAGLLEEFLEWYRRKVGKHIEDVRLTSISEDILYEFVRSKRLVDEDQNPDNLPEVEYAEIPQPNEKSRMIKKMRSRQNQQKQTQGT